MTTRKQARRGESRTRLGYKAPHHTSDTEGGNSIRLEHGNLDDWQTVGRVTETPMPGIARAVIRGNLAFRTVGRRRHYVLTDSTRHLSRSWTMEGRPLGGDPERGIGVGGEGWAIGLDRAAFASRIVIASDAGDFLAQHARATLEGGKAWAVISLLGSSETLSRAALRVMEGMEVEIRPDACGELLRQLGKCRCRVEIRNESAAPARP